MRTGAMTDDRQRRVRYGEAFWRAHHEAWQRSDLNQREYANVLLEQYAEIEW
jgi:hypothetical protein